MDLFLLKLDLFQRLGKLVAGGDIFGSIRNDPVWRPSPTLTCPRPAYMKLEITACVQLNSLSEQEGDKIKKKAHPLAILLFCQTFLRFFLQKNRLHVWKKKISVVIKKFLLLKCNFCFYSRRVMLSQTETQIIA